MRPPPPPTLARPHADDSVEFAYINLLRNAERYTGYKGEHAARVWGAIYDQARAGTLPPRGALMRSGTAALPSHRPVACHTCRLPGLAARRRCSRASTTPAPHPSSACSSGTGRRGAGRCGGGHPVPGRASPALSLPLRASTSLGKPAPRCRVLPHPLTPPRTAHLHPRRLISGMHSSITAHIVGDYLIDEATQTWGPNLEMFKWRLGNPAVKDRWGVGGRMGCRGGGPGRDRRAGRAVGRGRQGAAQKRNNNRQQQPHTHAHPPTGWRTSTSPTSLCCAPP